MPNGNELPGWAVDISWFIFIVLTDNGIRCAWLKANNIHD